MLVLRAAELDAVASSVDPPEGPLEGIDRFIRWLSKQQRFHHDFVRTRPDDICAVMVVPDGAAATFYLEAARDQLELIELRTQQGTLAARMTMKGWERHREIERVARDSLQAFVAMWFDDALDPVYETGLKLGIEDAGYTSLRVKDLEHAGKIDDLIIREIRRSGLLVADFTGQRANVYYEAGFADALGIPVVRTVRSDHVDDLHFDTRQYSHIVWDTPDDLSEKIRNRIEAVAPVGGRRLG